MIHHKEKAKSSQDNLPNFTNPLVSNTEEGNLKFKFKESTSKPDRLDFVEDTRKEICAHENENNWNLVRRI